MNYSISNFLKFIDELDQHINPETSRNITSLAHRLLDNESVNMSDDIRNIDFDKLIANHYIDSDISDSAKKMYVGRMNSGLRYFMQFLNGEKIRVVRGARRTSSKKSEPEAQTTKLEIAQTFSLPIPLREGFLLNISNLPLDLTEDEAERITRIIKSYATVKEN